MNKISAFVSAFLDACVISPSTYAALCGMVRACLIGLAIMVGLAAFAAFAAFVPYGWFWLIVAAVLFHMDINANRRR